MNYLECYTISREMVFTIANDYPKSRRVIRRFAMMMALKRKMLQLHEEEKKKTLEAKARTGPSSAKEDVPAFVSPKLLLLAGG